MSDPAYLFTTLGCISLARSSEPDDSLVGQARPLILLALLAKSPRLSGRRDHLAPLLWPDADLGDARRSLRQALFLLTKRAPDLIVREGERLTLNRHVIEADFWQLEVALRAQDFARVVQLYRGPFLAGQERRVSVELEHWIEAQNSQIHNGVELAYTKLIENAIGEGDTAAAVRTAGTFADVNPLDEAAQMLLVRALRADGDEVAALGAFKAYRTLLDREMGDAPSSEWGERMERVREEMFRTVVAGTDPAVQSMGSFEHRGEKSRVRRFVFVPILATLVAAVATIAAISLRARPIGPLANVSARVVVWVEQGADTTTSLLELDGTRVNVRSLDDEVFSDVPSPNNKWIAFSLAAADGWNLAIREHDTDSVVTLTSTPQDEFPLVWSPDSRYLVYARRRVHQAGRSYVHDLRVFDLNTRATRRLSPTKTSAARPSASWSPDGTQIVFTADDREHPDIHVIDFDGTRLHNITRNVARDAEPTWSPDRERIAFVSERSSGADVMTMRPDGTDLQSVAHFESSVESPRWLSQRVLAVLVQDGQGGDVWAVDILDGQTRQLTFRGDIVGLPKIRKRGANRWIDSIVVTPDRQIVSPGEHLTFGVVAFDESGDTTAVANLPIGWSARGPAAGRFSQRGGLRVMDVGRLEVIATLSGWRADTLRIVSLPRVELPIDPLQREDWTAPLDSNMWLRFGEPVPTTRSRGGPGGGVLVNNGDAFFESGVMLREPIPLSEGVTVEAYGRLPFTGQLHQTFGLGLRTDISTDSLISTKADFIVDFRIQGPTADEAALAWITTMDHREVLPVPRQTDEWNAYALQVLPDGTVELLVNGEMFWSSTFRISLEDLEEKFGYVTLGYRSFQTGIAHGPVAIYAGPKYVTPRPPVQAHFTPSGVDSSIMRK